MFEVQAFRYGRTFALQFHPDVTHAMMHRWTTRGHDRMEMPGAKPRHTHFADRAVYDYSARAWLSVFLEHWLAASRGDPSDLSVPRGVELLREIGDRLGIDLRLVPLQQHLEIGGAFAPGLAGLPA